MKSAPARKPAFIITIDTEGDNCWSRPLSMTTKNSRYLPRFQQLCEKYQLKPTYLTNWEMAHCAEFQSFARDVLKRGQAEVGMHLHAWNSPPLVQRTDNDLLSQPSLIDFPEDVMRHKIDSMTKLLEDTFSVQMKSHRAGRWNFNTSYARMLSESNYTVDCSVTPHISWKEYGGSVDYSDFPEGAYFLDSDDISRSGNSGLLEVPMTIIKPDYGQVALLTEQIGQFLPPVRSASLRLWPKLLLLRPDGRNRRQLHRILEISRKNHRDYVEFMLHSSELMPGGSPTFPDHRSIEKLYQDMEMLFANAASTHEGLTLSEYRNRFVEMNAAKHPE